MSYSSSLRVPSESVGTSLGKPSGNLFYQYRLDHDGLSKIPKTGKSIVLDVDETLVHTFDEDKQHRFSELALMEDPSLIDIRSRLYILPLIDLYRNGESDMSMYWGIMRPGLKDFLRFAERYFANVCIWSAGHKQYVERVCGNIFRGLNKPAVIFTSDDCDKIGSHNVKPLVKMYRDAPGNKASNIAELKMSPEMTFVLDDRSSTFSHNPLNGIQIPAYMPYDTIDGLRADESSLQRLTNWLMRPDVINSTDVRNLDKTGIFTGKIGSPRKSPRR